MKNDKSFWVAITLNFLVWGAGYFYLKKRIKGVIAFVLYCSIWFLFALAIFSNTPIIIPVIFWTEFWSIWCSIFLAYDTWKISKETKVQPLKIQKVKTSVRRSKVRTRKK